MDRSNNITLSENPVYQTVYKSEVETNFLLESHVHILHIKTHFNSTEAA